MTDTVLVNKRMLLQFKNVTSGLKVYEEESMNEFVQRAGYIDSKIRNETMLLWLVSRDTGITDPNKGTSFSKSMRWSNDK